GWLRVARRTAMNPGGGSACSSRCLVASLTTTSMVASSLLEILGGHAQGMSDGSIVGANLALELGDATVQIRRSGFGRDPSDRLGGVRQVLRQIAGDRPDGVAIDDVRFVEICRQHQARAECVDPTGNAPRLLVDDWEDVVGELRVFLPPDRPKAVMYVVS